MKKTLAAVLAAAMALSTATVAFAADTWNTVVDSDKTNNSTVSGETDEPGIDTNVDSFLSLTTGNGAELDTGTLAQAMDDNIIKSSVTITEGRNNFATIPAVTSQKSGGKKVARLRYKIAHNYGTGDIKVGFRVRFTIAKDAYYVAYTGSDGTSTEFKLVAKKPDSLTGAANQEKGKPYAIWNGTTWSENVADGVIAVKKGDTYVSDDYAATGKYTEVDYAEEITITEQECKDGKSLVKKDGLLDNVDDNGKVTIYFDDYASFTTKVSSAQKNLNLYYTTEVSSDLESNIVDVFPDVDFEFITFKGAKSVTSFVNSGEMIFPAIGGRNTVVYRYIQAGGGDSDYLDPIADYNTYDSTYGTLSAKVKDLSGTFVIASKMLDIEDEEDNEPVSSAPVVEEPSSSEAPSNDNERNPSTGAC